MADLLAWLKDHSLEGLHETLVENGVDLSILSEITEDDLKELGVSLGDRKRFLKGQRALGGEETTAEAPREEFADQEMRQLTLMFVDLVGSTALSNRLDLEAYRETLHIYQTICLDAIKARNGYVAQFLGDGVVSYFGYPAADEAAAEGAVLAGLRICEKIAGAASPAGEPLKVRIGIATGDVLIDRIAGDQALSAGLALGDTPNLAARLQGAAEPGQVAISDATRQLLGRNFEFRGVGPHDFKGFSDPVEVFIVTGHEDARLRFQARAGQAQTPLINRVDDLRTLSSRWRAARGGEGQVICLSGEAGIGKSRLVDAVVERIGDEDAHIIGLQCSHYRETSAFFPVISLVTASAGIRRTDDDAAKQEKLRALLADWAPKRADALPMLTALLGLGGEDAEPVDGLDNAEAKDRLQNLLTDLVLGLTRRRPLLLVFEDLHWIDPSSEELIDRLIQSIGDARLMLLCTYRPGYACPWEGLARVTTLPLTRLDSAQSQEMVRNLLGPAEEALPQDLEERIIARTDGVPLFVEEMVRMVRQRLAAPGGGGADPLSLPSTLKDLLRAQIDGLPSAREVVPVCAAIGRVIPPPLLAAVSGIELEAARLLLEQLVQSKLLVPHGRAAERTYSFRHALILDVAYESLPPSRARALHSRIADQLTGAFRNLAEASPEMLAHHYEKAKMAREARDAWRDAARLAASRWATKETLSHLRAALACNERAPGDDADTAEIGLRKMMVVALHHRGFASPAHAENYTRLAGLLKKTGGGFDATLPFVTVHNQFGALLMRGAAEDALGLCENIDAVAGASGEATLRLLAAHDRGMASFFLGAFDEAIAAYDEALAMRADVTAEQIFRFYPGDLSLVDQAMRLWALSLSDRGGAAARPELAAFVEQAAHEPHLFSRCYALAVSATAYQGLGDVALTQAVAEQAMEISRKTEFDYWSAWCRFLIGWTRAKTDDPEAGAAEIRAGIDAYLESGSTQMRLFSETLLADAHLEAGAIDAGLTAIGEIRALERTMSVRFQRAYTDRVEAALRAAT